MPGPARGALRCVYHGLAAGARSAHSSKGNTGDGPLVVVHTKNGVTTIRMDRPDQLNGWTKPMMDGFKLALANAAIDPDTKVAVLTGTGTYYCAGVNLAAVIKPMHPKKLNDLITRENQTRCSHAQMRITFDAITPRPLSAPQALFDTFLDFPKPIVAAVNGHAIGASVTSATLCDAIVASESATFSTPFHSLGVTPEGCSSVHFPHLMGPDAAHRMLGPEGWKASAQEWANAGVVGRVAPAHELQQVAQDLGERWISEGKTRAVMGDPAPDVAELKQVNKHESLQLAKAFMSAKFLENQ
eukprot:gene3661-682_t